MNEIINDIIKSSHKCDGCKWFQWLTPGVCGHAKLNEDCFEADDTVCKSDNAIERFMVKNEDGRLWSSYDTYEEALDVANELNATLDCLEPQWCVYSIF